MLFVVRDKFASNVMANASVSVLFVCLGNICRSPLAEGVFRHLVNERGYSREFHIDSCGTGAWHVGEPPHRESQKVAQKYGVSLDGQRARQVKRGDFSKFDVIVAMDEENYLDLESMAKNPTAEIIMLRQFDTHADDTDVPDPYYGGPEGFEEVFQIVRRSCEALLDDVERRFLRV